MKLSEVGVQGRVKGLEMGELREKLLKEATLNLDFANNKYEVYEGPVNGMTAKPFNEILDFSRAGGATARTATGGVADVLTNEQRLVGNREGLLIEGQRVNKALWSEDFTNPAWVKTDVTVTSDAGTSPDGLASADSLSSTAAGAKVVQTLGNSASNAGSFYMRNEVGDGKVEITLDGTTWDLFTITSEMSRYFVIQAGDKLGVRFPTSGQEITIWGAQAE